MGFLRKDWEWENPAEHSMEAHDAYRDESLKESKPWLWVLAFICGGISVYTLFYVEKYIYGGAVETNWAGWLGTMIGTFIAAGISLFKEPKSIKDEWGKGEKMAGWCFLAVFCIAAGAFIWKHQRMWIFGIQILSILPAAFVLDKAQKAGARKNTIKGWDLILTFSLLAIVTLCGPKLLGICTVEDAAEKLTQAGYTVEEYKYDIDSYWIDHILPDAKVEADTEDWGDVYLFAIKENSGEAIVEPWSGTIIVE